MNRNILLAFVGVVCAIAWSPATMAGETPCAECHDEAAASMTNQIHMRIEPFEVQGRQVGCEGCHGDGTQHIDEGDPALIRTFADKSAEEAAACLDCHSSNGLPEWGLSTHAMEGVTCFDCHSTHAKKNPLDSCSKCHEDVMAELQLPSHHPVREGKMSCTDCHDPHAGTEAQLRTNHQRVNDLCFQCHQAKEGPFIFEHQPVIEDCRICHSAHGSVANNLLTANEPMLCYQCHEPHFHAGLYSPEEGHVEVGGSEFENPFGVNSMNLAFTTRCTQCHSQIHGSDLPAQSLAGGGRGMVR